MNLIGTWIIKDTEHNVKITHVFNDEYAFNIDDQPEDFVGIYWSDRTHALLDRSTFFGRSDIIVLNDNAMKIGKFDLERTVTDDR